jgi:hypothetical protein
MPCKQYSLLDFQRMFSLNEACLEAISKARWPRGLYVQGSLENVDRESLWRNAICSAHIINTAHAVI